MRPILFILIPALALSACARTETPQEARAAARESRTGSEAKGTVVGGTSPGQIVTGGSVSLTPGNWSIAMVEDERMARFGEDGSAPAVTIACEPGGGVDIRLIGMPPEGGSGTVFIDTAEGGSTFTASEATGDIAAAYISVSAANPFIGLLVGGAGPFVIRMDGDRRIAFPADDILTSVVSSCARRDTPVSLGDLTVAPDSDDPDSNDATAGAGEAIAP